MDFDIVIGLHKAFHGCGVWHGSFAHHPTRDIWLYLPEEAIVGGVVMSINMYNGKIRVESVIEWTFNALNHELIHFVCRLIGEESLFDPIAGLGPEGL